LGRGGREGLDGGEHEERLEGCVPGRVGEVIGLTHVPWNAALNFQYFAGNRGLPTRTVVPVVFRVASSGSFSLPIYPFQKT
jgi:hypothetical protein